MRLLKLLFFSFFFFYRERKSLSHHHISIFLCFYPHNQPTFPGSHQQGSYRLPSKCPFCLDLTSIPAVIPCHYHSWPFRLSDCPLRMFVWEHQRYSKTKTKKKTCTWPRGRATLSMVANWNTAPESFAARQFHPECFMPRSLMRHHFVTRKDPRRAH